MNIAYIWIIKSFNKLDNGRFTTSRWPNKCNSFVLWDLNFHILDNLNVISCWILKLNILKVNGSIIKTLLSDLDTTSSVDFGLMEENLCDSCSCSKNTHYFWEDRSHLHEVDQEREHVKLERCELTDGKAIIWVKVSSKVHKGIQRAKHDKLHEKLESSVPKGLKFGFGINGIVFVLVLSAFQLFCCESLDGSDVSNGLLSHITRVSLGIGDLFSDSLSEFTVDRSHNSCWKHDSESEKSHFPRNQKEHDDHDYAVETTFQKHGYLSWDSSLDRGSVRW